MSSNSTATAPVDARILTLATSTATAMAKEVLVLGAWIQDELNTSYDIWRFNPKTVPANLATALKADAAIGQAAERTHYADVLRNAGVVVLGDPKLYETSKEVVRRIKTMQTHIFADRFQREAGEPELDANNFSRLFDRFADAESRKAARLEFVESHEDDAAQFSFQETIELIDELFELYRTTVAMRLYEKINRRIPASRIEAFWYDHVFGLFMYGLLLIEAGYAPTPEQSRSYADTAFRRLESIARESEQFTNSLIQKIVLNE